MHPVAAQHLARHEKSYAAAELLRIAGDEWATVAYFYAAFRAVRAAMYNDSRLNSDAAARAVDARLNAGSRHVNFHNGHPLRGAGVNDIVRLLYPSVSARYELLHTKSCEVRYESGLTAGSVDDMKALADQVIAELGDLGLL